ncbi:MAG: DUF2076 domain-containing protein [Rhizobiales bacterium]|nr:DUF2076 domain-containing protein [Hyphomicrobiales bacterium]
MTPEERQRVDELFERLAQLETAPRDAQAERAIAEGLARAPHAIYPLVQTVLVQDEALKRADARIRELSGEGEPSAGGGFLDSMRSVLTGAPQHTSVPSVRAAASEPDTRWNRGGALAASGSPAEAAPAPGFGGSFLGTAAASAAGFIGGALLLNSIGSMFGHRGGSAFGATPPSQGSPWDNSAANSDLARDAGINDIGRGAPGGDRSAGLLDNGEGDDGPDLGGDFGGDSGGGE